MNEGASQRDRELWRQRATELLRDAENATNCRHTRMTACFDAIYLRLLFEVNPKDETRKADQPYEPEPAVIVAGAASCGLDDDETGEILELREAVTALRYQPGALPGNLLRLLAIARHVVKSTTW